MYVVWCSQKFYEIKFLLPVISVFGLNCPEFQNSLLINKSKFKIQSKIFYFDTCNIILYCQLVQKGIFQHGLHVIHITFISVQFIYITFTISGREHFLKESISDCFLQSCCHFPREKASCGLWKRDKEDYRVLKDPSLRAFVYILISSDFPGCGLY